MPRVTKWEGQDLINLLALDVPTLAKMYGYSKEYIGTCRHRKRKEIREGKIVMPEGQPNLEGQLVKTWEAAAFDREKNEWVTTTLSAYAHTPDPTEVFTPAIPAQITPSKRKVSAKPYDDIFVFSDAQIDFRRLEDGSLEPIHDERALRVSRLLCRDIQPSLIINLGDTVDLAALSKFKPDSDHFHRTLGPAFQRVHDMYAELRADNPKARIIEVDSNHNTRLKDFGLRNAPQLYGLKQAGSKEEDWPVFSYPYLANLNHVGVEWISGYGAAEYLHGTEYNAPPIVFKHGSTTNSSGSTAAKESKLNPETHIVRGHSHSIEMHHRTTRAGRYLSSIIVGALCRTDGAVPSYHSAVSDRNRVVPRQEDWQNSVLRIRDFRNGDYDFQHIPIRDGIAYFEGNIYSGEET